MNGMITPGIKSDPSINNILTTDGIKIESKIDSNILSKSIQLLGKNKIANNFFTNSADNGII